MVHAFNHVFAFAMGYTNLNVHPAHCAQAHSARALHILRLLAHNGPAVFITARARLLMHMQRSLWLCKGQYDSFAITTAGARHIVVPRLLQHPEVVLGVEVRDNPPDGYDIIHIQDAPVAEQAALGGRGRACLRRGERRDMRDAG